MIHNISRFIAALAIILLTAQGAGATETSTITVGGTDYTLFTGFTATGGNGTNYAKLVDGNTSTDWNAWKSDGEETLDFNGGTEDPAFVEFHADEPIVPKGYVLTCYDEDAGFWKPVEWALKAKLNEGDGWTTIHSSNTTLGAGKTFEIACDNDGNNEYQYFRFEVYEVGTPEIVDLDELQFYGLLPAYTHLTVKAATCMATGIKQDCYRRNSDGKYFTDNTGTTELQESDVIAPMIPHTGEHHEATDVNIEYWQCSMCGKYFSDSGYTTEITEEQTKIYRTITIDGSISGLVTCYDSSTLAGETVSLYVSDLIDASTLKVNNGAVELTAVNDILYTFTMPAADVTVTAEVAQSNADGDVLTGSVRHTVTITNGASITLSDATITGSIVCEGSATITLVGTNSVSGAMFKAGIQIGGSGTTLTIKGDGSLTANGGSQSAGIGLSRIWKYDSNVTSGDIVIEGGTITATGGEWGAGIGTGIIKNTNNDNSTSVQFGNVTIKGGTVTATGGDSGDGIGKGYSYPGPAITFGTVTIYDGIDKVDASSIKNFASVVYMSGESNVTASKTDYFTIIENGDRRIIVKKFTPTIADVPDQTYTGSEITPEPLVLAGSLSLTKGTDYVYSYTDNTNVGTATVTVTFQGDYESLGSVEKEFTIVWSETDTDEYTIHNAAEWNVFCDCLNDNDTYNRFSGKTVQLGDDITVTRMAGGDGHEFTGTFDGGGHTLTVNYANTDNNTRTAPFSYVDGATIQNLIVGGTISGDHYRAAGIIGETVNTTSHITNCVSNVDISSDRYTGGFSIGGNVEIEGCVFNGKIKGTTYSGGFIGYSYSAQVIKNSLFAPQDGSSISGGTFYYNGGGDVAPVNSYYTQSFGTAQGKQAHTVSAGDNVTIEAIALIGTATQYTVSGITAYSGGGLQRGQTLYYGSGDQLSLTLSNTATAAPQGYQYGYTASAGTLSGSTLTMPDEDVTISTALAPIDWATVNQGNSADPYMIYNKDQLLLLAHRVNGTNGETANPYKGMYFKLGADITFSHDADEGNFYAENYEAIGTYIGGTYRNFKGNFDGDGHTVSGIRIRKTGSGDANSDQGLFGHIDGSANIYDVHLTDARITGYENVGGIAGYNNGGYISGCSVTDSYITATDNMYYGTICGGNYGTLTNNYYHGCTVNDTPVTSGVGCREADITADNGALPAYRLDLGANITTPPGTFLGDGESFATPPDGARLAPGNGFTLAGNHYFASGYVFTPGSTLASGAAQGYTPRATLGDQLMDLYTPTGDAPDYTGTAIARLTITADCDGKTLASTQAIYSTGQPVTVAYIKADGTPGEASAIALDGTETSLAAGWYFVGKDISYTQTLTLTGDVNLILADGKTMNVGTSGSRISGHGIAREDGADQALTIYGQNAGTGALNVYTGNGNKGIVAKAVTINGGNVTTDANGNWATGIKAGDEDITINGGNVSVTATGTSARAIYAYNNVTINGGTVEASGTADGIRTDNGDITINGGNVNASGTDYGINASYGNGNITLGWIRPADRITASSISTGGGGTVAVKDGQALTDGSGHIYTGTLTASELSGFAAETTLQPCLALADAADNTAAIADHAGQTLAVALSGRTLYKDGSWNTLCLPFAVDLTASGTLSGDNVQAMTLDTTTSTFADGTLTLNFTDATTIPAGTPFIIKWDNTGVNIENPVFEGVTVSNATNDATVADVLTFTGTYAPVSIGSEGDNTKLYLGAANKLYYPTKSMTIGTHRAYFQLADGITAGEPVSGSNAQLIRAFNLNFGDDEATGIISVHDSGFTVNASAAWYTLDGRRLDGQPTAKGLYIHGGKKVVIK